MSSIKNKIVDDVLGFDKNRILGFKKKNVSNALEKAKGGMFSGALSKALDDKKINKVGGAVSSKGMLSGALSKLETKTPKIKNLEGAFKQKKVGLLGSAIKNVNLGSAAKSKKGLIGKVKGMVVLAKDLPFVM